jgi:hypothetical protein
MANVDQPVTDNSIKVRQLTHYQFSTLDPDDADNLQDLLGNTGTVSYDIERRVLMFGVTPTGS